MNQETTEAVLTQFLHAYEDMLAGKATGVLLARLAISRLKDYATTNGQIQHYLSIVLDDFQYAQAVFAEKTRSERLYS